MKKKKDNKTQYKLVLPVKNVKHECSKEWYIYWLKTCVLLCVKSKYNVCVLNYF